MFDESTDVWTNLKKTEKPIIIYGMGDGADKILAVFDERGIRPAGFMASDEFVRGQFFCGFEVKKLSEIEKIYDDFVIVVAFGTSRPEVMDRLYSLAEKYELYAPELPVYGQGLFDRQYLSENLTTINETRGLFADEESKNTFDRLIEYKLSGKIEILKEITTPRTDAMSLLEIRSDGSETLVDLGAYTGDTVEEFLEITQKNFNKIFAFEPDAKNYIKLRRRLYHLGSAKLIPINAAAWDSDGQTEFSVKGGRNSFAGISRTPRAAVRTVPAKTVNSVCKSEKVTLIKIDTEGCESKALSGASDIIKSKPRPRLIIAAYHRTEDLFLLPRLVKKLDSKYKIYLRHHSYIPAWDTNLYCK